MTAAIPTILLAAGLLALAGNERPVQDFDRTVAPVLASRCLDCHAGPKAKGGLDLSRAQGVRTGGDSGPALVSGKPDDSLLWQRIRDGEMPPKKPLADSEKKLLRDWIASGAGWGSDPIDRFRVTTASRAGYDWWALQPVARPALPAARQRDWVRNPIDAFVLRHMEARGLAPSAEADRRTLIRRLSFDLLGLPPAPAEIDAFVYDPDPLAYEKVVERLLASPHHGERWARHWLDVIRYGESDGFERDLPRLNAWPYRGWVVESLNADLPYDEFVRRQLAGDVVRPDDPETLRATGFLVAGPHDIVVPASERMKATMRQDEMEDLLGTVGQTFLGLTVNCARCHDHKFDPIAQKDYYRLAAVFAGVGQGERPLIARADLQENQRLQARADELVRHLAALEDPIRRQLRRQRDKPGVPAGPGPIAEWDFSIDMQDRIGGLHGKAAGGARLQGGGLVLDGRSGYVLTEPLAKELREKTLEVWLRLDRLDQRGGGIMSVQSLDGKVFDAVVFGEREPGRWLAGSNFFERTQPFGGQVESQADKESICIAITYHGDGTISAYRDGRVYGKPYRGKGPVTFPARGTRVLFGLRHEPAGGNKHLAGTITRARLYDRALSEEEVAGSAGTLVMEAELLAHLSGQDRLRRQAWQEELAGIRKRLEERRGRLEGKVYAMVPGQPATTHVLLRGSVDARGEAVAPGGIASVRSGTDDFALPGEAAEGERRLALARWITDPRNPLTARVVVNRLWHYHFGVGLVDTPNDLGFNGGRPSHPELLDWLAAELVDQGWSLKAMHRLMVLSATYRQASRPRPEAARLDADNRLCWRHAPQRLEAEAIRDAMLAVSGELDRTIGGRGYQDTRSYFFKGTQFYDPLDQVGPPFNRRTLYRAWPRGGRSPFLDTFDCPDPSTATPRRGSTTTPLQALALLNNAQVLHLAERLADRLRREVGENVDRQIELAYALAYGRPAEERERALVKPFIGRHGLAAFCRVVFNSNEFLYTH